MNEVTMFGNQKVLLQVNPLLADGSQDISVVVSWSLDNVIMGQVNVEPDTKSAWFVPVEPSGSVLLTISAPEYKTEEVLISWVPGLRSLNLVINEPVDQ